jgi:broad specificity phosphatase PhoE
VGDIPRKEAKAFDANYLDHWPPPMMTDDGPVLRGLNVHPRLGAGESVRAMQMRVIQGFEAAIDIAEGRNLAIVTHAGPIAVMIAYWHREARAAASRRRRAAAKWYCSARLTATSAPASSVLRRLPPDRTQW